MKLFVFIAFVLLWGTTLASEVSFGTGEDPDCNLAKNYAIQNAIERFAEQEIDVTKKHTCQEINGKIDCSYRKTIESETSATFKKLLSEKVKKKKDLCVVEVKVELEKPRVFQVSVKTKDFFFTNENLELFITTREPLYVYVFNIYHQEKVTKLYPSGNNHTLVNGNQNVPSTDEVRFSTYLFNMEKFSEETLLVLFTKHKITFKRDLTKVELDDIIKSIPPYSRRVVYHNYVIKRR